MPATVYLALGTNLGERPANLRAALLALSPALRVLQVSSVYETDPWGYAEQPAFLNLALQAQTDLPPAELLQFLKEQEARLGRAPGFRYGPRLIDLDILFYADLVLDTATLTLPHPRLQERPFVLVPLAEIAPRLQHPRLGRSIADLLQTAGREGVRLYGSLDWKLTP
jgi:2-amino-4-hydroxy-6-hydroxymethyldihydropteridine diphosphokinase